MCLQYLQQHNGSLISLLIVMHHGVQIALLLLWLLAVQLVPTEQVDTLGANLNRDKNQAVEVMR